MRTVAILIALLLSACEGGEPSNRAAAPPDLESAAIERGVIRDPADTDLTGLYARGTDRICIVSDGGGYRIGVASDYGGGITCNGGGRVSRSGETLQIELGACSFEARFDGERISFPGRMPSACAALCDRRASLAGVDVERLSESRAEAASMRGADGKAPCG